MIKTVLDSSFDDFDIISNNNKQALTVIHRRHRHQRSTPQYHRLYIVFAKTGTTTIKIRQEHKLFLQPFLHLQDISSKTLDGAESKIMYSGVRNPLLSSAQPFPTGDGSDKIGVHADFQI